MIPFYSLISIKSSSFRINLMKCFISNIVIRKKAKIESAIIDEVAPVAYSAVVWASKKMNAIIEINTITIDIKTRIFL